MFMSVRMTREQKTWVMRHGGGEYLRRLIDEKRVTRIAPKRRQRLRK
jgi:hypothetical protein